MDVKKPRGWNPKRQQQPSIAAMGLELNASLMLRERIRAGWTQEQVGERLGVNRSLVAMLERGTRQPSHSLLEKIAALWGVPAKDCTVAIGAEAALAGAAKS